MHTFVVCSESEKTQQNVIHETALVCERFRQDSEMNSFLRMFSLLGKISFSHFISYMKHSVALNSNNTAKKTPGIIWTVNFFTFCGVILTHHCSFGVLIFLLLLFRTRVKHIDVFWLFSAEMGIVCFTCSLCFVLHLWRCFARTSLVPLYLQAPLCCSQTLHSPWEIILWFNKGSL